MPVFRNIAGGARGVRSAEGELVMIEPGQSADVDANKGEIDDAEASGFFEIGGADPAEPGPLDGSVDDLIAHIAEISDPDEIERLLEGEKAGKTRKGALAALEARRDELLAN